MTERRTRYPGPIAEAAKHPHGLVEQGFASDEALAEILHRYPAELIEPLAHAVRANAGPAAAATATA